MMVGQGAALALAGACVGTGAGVALSGVFRHHLYDVSAKEPATYIALAVVVMAIAVAAAWAPARRATRVHPSRCLQES